jgi:hypothetical protein
MCDDRPMGLPRAGVVVAASVGATLTFAAPALAAGPCDAITQRSNEITQEQLAFTNQAYSDGQITPEEAAKAEDYSRAIQKVTADLGECIRTGKAPPGYGPPKPPPDRTPPVSNTFEVEIAKWRIGDHALKISWHTSEPTRVRITFTRLGKPARAAVLRKTVVGALKALGQVHGEGGRTPVEARLVPAHARRDGRGGQPLEAEDPPSEDPAAAPLGASRLSRRRARESQASSPPPGTTPAPVG